MGIGDYEDFLSGSERLILGNANLHDSTKETFEEWQDRLVDRFYKEIEFMNGRLIGLIEGNHFATYQDGTTTTQRLCQKMGCKYLGTMAFIRLALTPKSDNQRHIDLDIVAHHGIGGGGTAGNSINQVKKLENIAPAKIYMMGHDHQKNLDKKSQLIPYVGKRSVYLRSSTTIYMRTGSFLRSYMPGSRSYIVSKAGQPADLGTIKIELTPTKKSRMIDGKECQFREVNVHASL